MADHPPSQTPTTLMHSVATDLFTVAKITYIALVNRASGFLLVKPLRSTNTATVCNTLADWFNNVGWPTNISSDGGPQFRDEFKAFCKQNDINHEINHCSVSCCSSDCQQLDFLLSKKTKEQKEFLASFGPWGPQGRAQRPWNRPLGSPRAPGWEKVQSQWTGTHPGANQK